MAAFHNGVVENATAVLTSLLKIDVANTRAINFESAFQGTLRPAAQVLYQHCNLMTRCPLCDDKTLL